ncbi:MAG: chromosome segregation protein SMC [Nitrospinota bacterium]|nr:chromosome segregation protein SMC [Nitrospinota bacterium]
MFFKSLEVRGFKSFVDHTKIDFESGITAIVGPNGCGKSNIADAMRWVLGEQSAKMMRGSKMEDFIFNGSAHRKPTGFAEVTMTISNENGAVSTAPYSEYPEISVTRKYYRNGDSDYFINKVPCRLKDIVDIFLDTGVSARTLSVIEQGQVNRLINAKPMDRRVFIDEAAGIMKYKLRRNAARNKLELSQQNLLRIKDIIAELERQRSSLNRQAKKAERYKTYKAEVKHHALLHYSGEFQRLNSQIRSLENSLEGLKENEAAAAAQLDAVRNKLETANVKVTRQEKDISSIREEKGAMESAMEKNHQHRAFLTTQVEELIEKRNLAQAEIVQVEKSMADGDACIVNQKEELTTIEAALKDKAEQATGLRAEQQTAGQGLADMDKELSEGTRAAMALMEEVSTLKNEQSSIKTRLEMAISRVENLGEKESRMAKAMEDGSGKLDAARQSHDSCAAENETEQKNVAALTAQMEELSTAIGETSEKLRAVSENIAVDQSRLESLLELERNMEGYGKGVRALMKLKQKGAESASGVTGLVAEHVTTPAGMETAVAAAMGGRLEAVIVDSFESLNKAVDALNQGDLGSAGFVVSSASAAPREQAPVPDHSAIKGRATDFITADQATSSHLVAALADTLVVDGFDNALEIWRANPGVFTLITLAGEAIDRTGFVTGGPGGSGVAGLVSRKRMIEELQTALTVKREEKQILSSDKEEKTAAMAELKQKLTDSQAQARKLELETVRLANEIRKAEAEIKREDEALQAVLAEVAQLKADKEKLAEALQEKDGKIEVLMARKGEIDSTNESARSKIAQARAALDEIVHRVRDKEVEATELKGKLSHVQLDIKRMEDIKAADIVRVQRLKDSIADSDAKEAKMKGSIESVLAENGKIAKDIDSISTRISAKTDDLNEMTAEAEALSGSISQLAGKVEQLRTEVSEAALKKSEAEMRTGNVVEKADVEFNIPVDDLSSTSTHEVDMAENETRLTYLRGQLARMGDVNMSAIEEFEQIEERFTFLSAQRDDLETSIATLHKTIESLNATTNKLFNETFKVVSENFEMIFKRLFGGGNAQMRLVEEEGKPEPGVEIFAQPPGKKNQSITLLSAGEKAMTAISLLFAVFLSKPSPFCLLDEIDAPLDEANIGRFRDLLGDMQEKTQFIIITHNQKTMGFADRLYGVTQEEDGVSKVLAVNLKDERPHTLSAA